MDLICGATFEMRPVAHQYITGGASTVDTSAEKNKYLPYDVEWFLHLKVRGMRRNGGYID